MRSLLSNIMHRHNKTVLIVFVIGLMGLFLSKNYSIVNVGAEKSGKSYYHQYALDVVTGEPPRLTEIGVSAAYLVSEHPQNIAIHKLNVRPCLLGILHEQINQDHQKSIKSLLALKQEEIVSDVVACMLRFRDVRIEILKLEFDGVKDKGPFHLKPLPEQPELPSPPKEDENGARSRS